MVLIKLQSYYYNFILSLILALCENTTKHIMKSYSIELAAKRPLVAAIKIVTRTNSKNSAIPPVKPNSILYPVIITTTTF